MSGKQMVNVSEGICFRLANVVSLHCVEDGLHSTMLKLARHCSRLHHLCTANQNKRDGSSL